MCLPWFDITDKSHLALKVIAKLGQSPHPCSVFLVNLQEIWRNTKPVTLAWSLHLYIQV